MIDEHKYDKVTSRLMDKIENQLVTQLRNSKYDTSGDVAIVNEEDVKSEIKQILTNWGYDGLEEFDNSVEQIKDQIGEKGRQQHEDRVDKSENNEIYVSIYSEDDDWEWNTYDSD